MYTCKWVIVNGRTSLIEVSMFAGGTIKFLFTDIEGSRKMCEQDPIAMQAGLTRHDQIMEAATRAFGGLVVKSAGWL